MNGPRLRILLAIGIYEPERGGAAEWLCQYAAWLAGQGHEVCIACEQAFSPAPESCRLVTLPSAQQTKNSWKRAAALQSLVEQQKADIVHDTGCLLKSDVFHPLMGSLMDNWLSQLRSYPLPLRLRRFWHVRVWRDVRLQWHQIRHHRVLVATSRKAAADFARLGCANTQVIPNGIALKNAPSDDLVKKLRQELAVDGRMLVLMTPTNFYLKGVMTLLKSLNLMEAGMRDKFRFVITGRNRDEAFPDFIRRHGLGECCRLIGWIEKIDDHYHAADIFLHPTYHDAGSLSTLKALAAGCAVVTSRFDGASDLIENGVNGMVLQNPTSADELIQVLKELLDAGGRRRLSVAAQQLKPMLAQERQFERLEQLYFETLKSSRSNA